MYEPPQTDVRSPELRVPPDETGAGDLSRAYAGRGATPSNGRGNSKGNRTKAIEVRGNGGPRLEDLLPNMVESTRASSELEILKHQLNTMTKSYRRLFIAYDGLVEVHAKLMLDALTREAIKDDLEIYYQFALTSDAIEDLRGKLNEIDLEDKRRLRRYNFAEKISRDA